MKTILTRMQALLKNDPSVAQYAKGVQVTAPSTIPQLTSSLTPWVGIAPVNSVERDFAMRRETTYTIEVYVVNFVQKSESAMMGVGGLQGLLDMIGYVGNALRDQYFRDSDGIDYLSKPVQLTRTAYETASYGDNYYLLVATIGLDMVRLWNTL